MFCIHCSDAIVMVVNDDMYDRTFYVRVGIGMLLLLIERTILWLFDERMMEEEVSRPLWVMATEATVRGSFVVQCRRPP